MAAEAKGPSRAYAGGGGVAQNLQQDRLPEWFLKTVQKVELTVREIRYITTSSGEALDGRPVEVQNISDYSLYAHNLGIKILIRPKQTVTLPRDDLGSRLTTSIVEESRGLTEEKTLLCAFSLEDVQLQRQELDFRTVKALKLQETAASRYEVTCKRVGEVMEFAEGSAILFEDQKRMDLSKELWNSRINIYYTVQYTDGRKQELRAGNFIRLDPKTVATITIREENKPPLVIITNLGAQIAV